MPVDFENEIRVCGADDCEETFTPRTFNQKYHNSDCTQRQTNKALLKRYHEKRNKKSNKGIKCKTEGCITLLSSYNDSDICELCKRKDFEKRLEEFGWDREDYEDFEL